MPSYDTRHKEGGPTSNEKLKLSVKKAIDSTTCISLGNALSTLSAEFFYADRENYGNWSVAEMLDSLEGFVQRVKDEVGIDQDEKSKQFICLDCNFVGSQESFKVLNGKDCCPCCAKERIQILHT